MLRFAFGVRLENWLIVLFLKIFCEVGDDTDGGFLVSINCIWVG